MKYPTSRDDQKRIGALHYFAGMIGNNTLHTVPTHAEF